MKRITIACVILLTVSWAYAQDTIRIMTYNIEAGVAGKMADIGQYIKSQKPDIVALQEIDQWAYRAKRKSPAPENQIVDLAAVTDMLPIFSPTCNFGEIGYYGIGLLTKYNIKSFKRIVLPQTNPDYEPRVILIAELDIKGKSLTIVNTHLSLYEEDRVVQTKFIAKQLRKIRGPKLLCGDFNARQEEINTTRLAKYRDALPEGIETFPSVNPRAKLDYILMDPKDSITIINQHVDKICDLSDHCPCYVDIVLK